MKNKISEAIRVGIVRAVPAPLDCLSVSFEHDSDHAAMFSNSYQYRASAELQFLKIAPGAAEQHVKEDAIRSFSHHLYGDVIEELHGLADDARQGRPVMEGIYSLIDVLEGRRR